MRNILSFEYMPLTSMIINKCLNRTLCHDFLALWKNIDAWNGMPKEFVLDIIKKYLDGEKFK
jgi:hypothetical protein